jgi:Tfp pilus assembly protein PilV
MYSAMNRATDGPSTAIRRSRLPRLGDETGFGLIEGIVAAVVLAVLALGLLAGIDGAAGSAGREKLRAVAASLAEQDQERMRAMRAVDLPAHTRTWTTTVGDVEYKVVSDVDWVSDATAAPVSCTSTGGKADLLRLRTTVTSTRLGNATAGVSISSLLAPPIGSAGGANGTLAVALENRDGGLVAGLPVTVTSTDGSYSDTKVTNALGCALFTYIPADTYDVALNTSPYVDPDGVQGVVASDVTVAAGELSTKELVYDKKATLTASFDTTHWDPVTASWKTRASRGREVMVTNGGLAATARIFTYNTAAAAALQISATNLFPFSDGYGVFSGACQEQKPSAFDATWAATNAWKKLDPLQSASMTIRQPALPVRVASGTNGGSGTYKNEPKWVGGANVQAKLVGLPTSSPCYAAPDTVPGITQDSANGLQSFPSGIATYSGTLAASNYGNGLLGFVTRKAPSGSGAESWSGGHFDPGVPWGTWQVCADSGGKRNFVTVVNKRPAGSSTYVVLDLGSASAQNATCGAGSWPAPVLPGWGA